MNNKYTSLFLLVIVATATFFLGRGWVPSSEPTQGPATTSAPVTPSESVQAAPVKADIWTCSMHPQIRMPEPGACPICGMALIVADSGDDGEGASELRLSPGAVARAGIRTARVARQSLFHELPLVGKVALDETRVATISSWVAGRLDRLFVDYTGTRVRAGDHLAEIYSPTLYSAQEELLQALSAAERVSSSDLEILRASTARTVLSARERLRLFGLDEAQIDALVERGEPEQHMTLRAPIGGVVVHKAALEGMFVKEGSEIVKIADLSKVWVQLDAYESDLAWLRYGQLVHFSVEAYPGEVFESRVAFIDPVLDPRTRTVHVRLNVDNAERRLKPEMFVTASVQAQLSERGQVVDASLAGLWMCPMHPEVTGTGPGVCSECGMDLVPVRDLGFVVGAEAEAPIAVPDTAPLFTGRRSVVYVQLPDHEEPTFEGREVQLGPHAGDWYVVLEGLAEGEDVVVNGNFKIDSELQIRAKHSMMSPDAVEPVEAVKAPRLDVPEAFRVQLSGLVTAYLELGRALAEDHASEAERRALLNALEGLDMQLLSGAAHVAWMEVQPELRTRVEALARATDLEAARVAFGALSESWIGVLERFSFAPGALEPGTKLAVFHCPMAFDFAGADWLGVSGPVVNPYFGSEMPRCGTLERELDAER